MERLGIWTGGMFETVGTAGFLYEIAIYWPDVRTVYHEQMLEKDFLAKLPSYPGEPRGARLRREAEDRPGRAVHAKFGAAHFQLGRAYPLRPELDRQADALLVAIKAQLDPRNLMNPGALGLGG